MADTPIEELNKYNKRIDDLMENAEIEAEIDAENRIRSKNSRIMGISLVALLFLGFLYMEVKKGPRSAGNEGQEIASLEKAAEDIHARQMEPAPPASATEPSPTGGIAEATVAPAPAAPSTEKIDEMLTPKKPSPRVSPRKPVTAFTKASPGLPTVKPQKVAYSPKSSGPAQTYHVQLGAFSVKENAEKFSKQVRAKGFPARVETKALTSKHFQVFSGEFPTQESGQQMAAELKNQGFNPTLEKNENNGYNLIAGRSASLKQATELKDRLNAKGFLSSLQTQKQESSTYIVEVGAFHSAKEAKSAQIRMTDNGFKHSFIR